MGPAGSRRRPWRGQGKQEKVKGVEVRESELIPPPWTPVRRMIGVGQRLRQPAGLVCLDELHVVLAVDDLCQLEADGAPAVHGPEGAVADAQLPGQPSHSGAVEQFRPDLPVQREHLVGHAPDHAAPWGGVRLVPEAHDPRVAAAPLSGPLEIEAGHIAPDVPVVAAAETALFVLVPGLGVPGGEGELVSGHRSRPSVPPAPEGAGGVPGRRRPGPAPSRRSPEQGPGGSRRRCVCQLRSCPRLRSGVETQHGPLPFLGVLGRADPGEDHALADADQAALLEVCHAVDRCDQPVQGGGLDVTHVFNLLAGSLEKW